jgi:acetyl esterase/lipase
MFVLSTDMVHNNRRNIMYFVMHRFQDGSFKVKSVGILSGFVLCAVLAFSSYAFAGGASIDLKNTAHIEYSQGVIGIPNVTYSVVPGYRSLTMSLFVPTQAKGPYPIVIFVHGGGWMMDPGLGESLSGSDTLSKLAARGYLVARPSYRLSSEAKFPAALKDIKAAVQWLKSNAGTYNADPSRIAIWGASAGGTLAALVGTSCEVKEFNAAPANQGPPGLAAVTLDAGATSCVQAVIDWYGPIDFPSMDSQSLPGSMKHNAATSAESTFIGCTLPECPPGTLKAVNPITYITPDDPPFLIMHGTADTGVPYQQSMELYDALQAKGVKSELVLVPDANHMFEGVSKEKRQELVDKVFQFIDKSIGKGEK